MPIHDQGYRRYGGTRRHRPRVAGDRQAGIRTMIAQARFIGLMLLAWAPFVVRAVQIYVAANFPQASFLAPKGETFREFLEQQGIFVFFVTIYVGAGLIANDRRANALQLYLSKPLTRAEYIAGKLAILLPVPGLGTFLPAMMLLLMQALFAGSFTFVRNNIYLLPAITLFSLLQVLLAASTMLALSSLSKSSRFVGRDVCGPDLLHRALFKALRGITGTSSLAWLSPTDLARTDRRRHLPPRAALRPAAGRVARGLVGRGPDRRSRSSILERRVRGVEVVT